MVRGETFFTTLITGILVYDLLKTMLIRTIKRMKSVTITICQHIKFMHPH